MQMPFGLIKKHLVIETANTAASLTAEQLKDADGNKAHAAIITIEDADVRLTMDGETTPTQGPAGVGLRYGHGAEIRPTGVLNLESLAWISAEADTPARLQIALEFYR